MILIIRGHIRQSFDDDRLYKFIYNLTLVYKLKIYIHTWNIKQSQLSWRRLKPDTTEITPDVIIAYFKNISHLIQHIIIEDDKYVNLIGNTYGRINNGPCPIKGWKFYWHGQYKIIEYIRQHETMENEIIVNTRFDIFNNSNKINESVLFNVLRKYKHIKFQKNMFINNLPVKGVDNVIVGNINTQYKLIQSFHFNLDNLIIKLPKTVNQEKLVYYLNELIF